MKLEIFSYESCSLHISVQQSVRAQQEQSQMLLIAPLII